MIVIKVPDSIEQLANNYNFQYDTCRKNISYNEECNLYVFRLIEFEVNFRYKSFFAK